MGRDKAMLPFDGKPLAMAAVEAVRKAAGNATLVGDPERYRELGLRVIPDLYPGEGPLGGILTALGDSKADWNLVTACDMPALHAGFLTGLCEAAEASGAQILLPADASGRPEPLCAIYHRECRKLLERAYGQGVRKVTAAFEGIPTARLVVEQVSHFQNVNTPEDWAAYARG
jgi:molybdopterin-guanine dinucleotide biosynthesis protein A